MHYRLLKALNYYASKKYPLILSLHGRNGIGTDNVTHLNLLHKDIMTTQQWRSAYPCFVLIPENTGHWSRPRALRVRVARDGIAAHLHPTDQDGSFLK